MIASPASLVSAMAARHGRTVQRDVAGDFYRVTLQAMSTPVRLVFRARRELVANDFQRAALEWLALFEARYSRFQPDSIVSQINARAGGDWLELDEEADAIFSLCDDMHGMTRQTFDAAMLPLLKLWNWKADPIRIPSEVEIQNALALCGWEKVLHRAREIRLPIVGMGIDLGGIGKEYAVDELMTLAGEHGLSDVMIDIGQDLRVRGHPPGKTVWMIGLEEPTEPGKCWTAVALKDHAVATSGDYFRSFTRNGKRYGHILDPRNGQPVRNGCQAVSVIAPNCVLAGVLSTAAFILGPEQGLELIKSHAGADACITTESARHQTRRFSSYVPL
jgi:thiamine biosynthesis lipoprotein